MEFVQSLISTKPEYRLSKSQKLPMRLAETEQSQID